MSKHALPRTLLGILLPAAAGLALMLPEAGPLPAPASAQQLPGKMPVTPFGPRVKPPAAAPRAPVPRGPRPKPEIVDTFKMWKVICEQIAGPDKKPRKTCYVSATATDPKRKNVFLSLIVVRVSRKDKDGKVITGHMMNVRAPIGVYLPTGIALEIDGKPIARVPFIRCNPVYCESLAEAREKTLALLKKGAKARFIIYAAPGAGLPLEFRLAGFTAAMNRLAKLP